LRVSGSGKVPMTFQQVEKIIGRKLPRSAFRHRPWWANEERGHSHAKAWLDAGFVTEQVDMAGRKLVFRRKASPRESRSQSGLSESNRMFKTEENIEKKPVRSPLWGALKGTFVLVPPDDEPPPEEPESWEALTLAKLDKLLFDKGE
jgi:hypothetical protein